MVEALLEARARGEADLSKLEALVKKANELRTNLEALVRAIESKYAADPRLGGVVKNLLRAIQPQEPPGDQLLTLSSSLEKYVSSLETAVKALASYAVALDRLHEDLVRLEKEAGELAAWEELLREVAPHLAAEAAKLVAKARRLLSQPPLEDPQRALDEVELCLKEVRAHARVCRTVYSNRLNDLLSEVSQLLKSLKRASRAQTPLEAGKLLAHEESLKRLEERLEEALRRPLELKLDLAAVKRELEGIGRELAELAESALSGEESGVAKELERLARSLESRSVSYASLVESLSRRSGLPIEKVCYLLYALEKKGYASLEVRVKV